MKNQTLEIYEKCNKVLQANVSFTKLLKDFITRLFLGFYFSDMDTKRKTGTSLNLH